MKINWRKKFKTSSTNLLWGGCYSILIAVAVFCIEITKPVIKTKNDLIFIKGLFNNYSWVSRSKGSRLTFRLQNCRDNFQVAADFYSILKKDFKNISYGDTVKISIPSVHEKYLNKGKKLLQVFSVEGNQKIYLNYYDSIRKYNSFLMKFIIGLFLIIGVTALYYRHKSFPPKRKQTMPVQ